MTTSRSAADSEDLFMRAFESRTKGRKTFSPLARIRRIFRLFPEASNFERTRATSPSASSDRSGVMSSRGSDIVSPFLSGWSLFSCEWRVVEARAQTLRVDRGLFHDYDNNSFSRVRDAKS